MTQEGEEEEDKGPEPLKFPITETQRLRFMMENISKGTNIVRCAGFYLTDYKRWLRM